MRKLLIAALLALAPMLAAAQADGAGKPVIKVIAKPARGVPANHPLAPGAVTDAVGKILGDLGYRWEPLESGEMAVGDTAIRVLYIVSEPDKASGGQVVAASAATALLQRANLGQSIITLSLYNGIQQSIGQEPATEGARAEVYQAFVEELRQRIGKALEHLESL